MFNLILLDWCKMTNIFVVLMRCQCYFLIVMIQLQLKVCVQIFLNKVIFYIFDLIWPCLGMVGECWYTRGFHSCSRTKSQKSYLAVFICSQHLTKIQTFYWCLNKSRPRLCSHGTQTKSSLCDTIILSY